MTVPHLARDGRDLPIPVLKLGTPHSIVVNNTSARNATAFGAESRVITLHLSAPAYAKQGNNTVTATASDHYLPAGTHDISLGHADGQNFDSHIALLRASGDFTAYISERG